MQKITTTCILLLFASFSGFCQILDDSTKLVYSAKTSMSFTQNTIENNTNQKNTIDTSLFHIHNYQYFYKDGILYQDLGNFGTPLNRIYYDAPTSIGKTIGLNTLIDYSYDINTTKYYDTKSPYTKLNYIQGSKGLQIMEVLHTQNIKPNWNVGISFKRMVANKIIGVSTRQEKQSSNYSFVAHTSYFSKNNRYKFLFNLNLFQHQQYENGGIYLDTTETKADMFDYQLEKVQLYSIPRSTSNKKNLRSYDRRSNFRFYNEYSLADSGAIQLFHQFDYQTNFIRYDDDFLYNKVSIYQNIDNYANTYYNTLATNDRIVYELYENKIGIKGSANKLFYKGYYRLKNFQYRQENYENFVAKYTENFVGGNLEYRFSDTTKLAAKAEYYLGRDYLFQTDFYSRFLDLGYTRTYYSPTLFQMHNYSNNYRWSNNFNNTLSDLVYAKGKLDLGNLHLHPWVSYNKVENLIYNDTQSNPTQSGSVIEFLSAGLIGKVNWRSIYFEDQVRYTKTTGADIWRVPELFNKASLYLYGPLFKKALRIQMGVDMTWKSGYYANAYAPGSNQFHLSDKTNDFNFVDAYMIADVYLNAQIKRAFIFLKMSHVNMNLPAEGYQITPYYTGMPRTFQFGVKWLFYD